MKGMRGERLGEEIRREIAEILQSRVRDPGLGMTGVTRVEVSPDGTHARVFVSVLGDEDAQARSLRALERAAGFIRGELARRLSLRRIPELAFRVDHGIEHSIRVQRELRALGLDAGGEASPDSAGDGDGEADGSGAPDAEEP